MMVPILNAADGSPEERYTRRHAQARAVIERCNGLLKARFRCLLRYRVLQYAPSKATSFILACTVLHNMCITHRIGFERDEDDRREDEMGQELDGEVYPEPQGRILTPGQRQRARIIQRHFRY